MNIGIVTEGYPPIYDGVSNYVSNLSQSLREKGHNVYIFAPEYPRYSNNKETNVIRFPSARTLILPHYRLSMPWSSSKLFHNYFTELRLDIVHSQVPSIVLYPASQTCQELGIPHIITYHTYLERYVPYYIPMTPHGLAKWLARIYSSSVCNRSLCVIVPSMPIKEVLQSYGIRTRVECIPCGIDTATFKNADGTKIRKKLGFNKYELLLIYVGRLTYEKNIKFLFEVLMLLREESALRNLRMIVVGTGRHESEIKKDCMQLGLNEAVIFKGLITDHQKLAELYTAADVFVFASHTETFGLVLAEAQACGTPVVAIAAGGTHDVIQNGYGGFLIQPDIKEFTSTVKRLLLDVEFRRDQSIKAVEHAQKFSIGDVTNRLLDIYEDALRAKN